MWRWWALRKLRSSDLDVRCETVRALLAAGDLEPLVTVSRDEDDAVRWEAVEGLAKSADPRAVAALLERLQDRHFNIREAAVKGLAATGDRRAVLPLVEVVKSDGESQVRRAALEALVALGDPRSVDPLIEILSAPDPARRAVAIETLGRLGDPRAVPPLAGLLRSDDDNTRWLAIESLGRLRDPRAVEPLLRAVAAERRGPREAAIMALGSIGDPRALPALLPLLSDRHHETREVAGRALKTLGWSPADQEQRALLDIALQDWKALEQRGPAAVGLLLERLVDLEKRIADAALGALGALDFRPTTGRERALVAVARGAFEAAVDEGSEAVDALVGGFGSQDLASATAAGRALEKLLETRAGELPESALSRLADLPDGWGVAMRIVYNSSCDETGHSDAYSETVSGAQVRQLARQELVRRNRR